MPADEASMSNVKQGGGSAPGSVGAVTVFERLGEEKRRPGIATLKQLMKKLL
jgi:hypothetical protein